MVNYPYIEDWEYNRLDVDEYKPYIPEPWYKGKPEYFDILQEDGSYYRYWYDWTPPKPVIWWPKKEDR